MSTSDPVVIVSAVRTPLGRFQGDLSSFSAHNLGSHAIGAALERAKLSPDRIDEVLMGCVLPAGQGQAPARQAARGAKLPDATGATTINKVCGSGMKATMLAHDIINAGSADIVVSGGMESMTNAPYLLQKALLKQWEELPLTESVNLSVGVFGKSFLTGEPQRHMQAFLDRRK